MPKIKTKSNQQAPNGQKTSDKIDPSTSSTELPRRSQGKCSSTLYQTLTDKELEAISGGFAVAAPEIATTG